MVDTKQGLNILQIAGGTIFGFIISNTEKIVKDYYGNRKDKRAKIRDARNQLLRAGYYTATRTFLTFYGEEKKELAKTDKSKSEDKNNKHLNNIKDYDCLIIDEKYDIIKDITKYKTIGTFYSTKSENPLKILSKKISKLLSNSNSRTFEDLKTHGCHDSQKWTALGLQILGKPSIIYTDHKDVTHELHLKTPLTLICNPHHEYINFLNLYEITNHEFSTSASVDSCPYMLYNLQIPLFDLIKKNQDTTSKQKEGNISPTPSLHQQEIEEEIGLDLHPYAVKTNLIKYLHNEKDQVKILEIYSGEYDTTNQEYEGFSGVIRIYFSKTATQIINNFTKSIDYYADKIKEKQKNKEERFNRSLSNTSEECRRNNTISNESFRSTKSSKSTTSTRTQDTNDIEI